MTGDISDSEQLMQKAGEVRAYPNEEREEKLRRKTAV
jgi:hypothetical protein